MQEWVIRQQFFKIVSFPMGIAPSPHLSLSLSLSLSLWEKHAMTGA